MRKTIGANWTRVIKHVQLLCNWQYLLLQSNAVTPIELQRPGNCLDATFAVREIQRARVVTSNIDNRFAK